MTQTYPTEPFPTLDLVDSAPTTPQHDSDAPMPTTATPSEEPFSPHYEGPLYTEINIPLPDPVTPTTPTTPQDSTTTNTPPPPSQPLLSPRTQGIRPRSHTLSSISPFRHSRSPSVSSTTSTSASTARRSEDCSWRNSEEWPNLLKDFVRSRDVSAMMEGRSRHSRSRSCTVDALAVVPAVLVMRAELFTPAGEVEDARKDSGVGSWEDEVR